MALEELFIDGDALDGDNPLPALDFEHPINQQKGVAMGEDSLDLSDVHGRRLSFRGYSDGAI
jgi:hypothetical protein